MANTILFDTTGEFRKGDKTTYVNGKLVKLRASAGLKTIKDVNRAYRAKTVDSAAHTLFMSAIAERPFDTSERTLLHDQLGKWQTEDTVYEFSESTFAALCTAANVGYRPPVNSARSATKGNMADTQFRNDAALAIDECINHHCPLDKMATILAKIFATRLGSLADPVKDYIAARDACRPRYLRHYRSCLRCQQNRTPV